MLTICKAEPTQWREYRELRLEMLADSPHSFGDRLADAKVWDQQHWQARLASRLLPDSTLLVAVDETGRWLGQMVAREYSNYTPARAWLLEVYLTPEFRGQDLATRLLAEIESWVAGRGLDRLYLDVHERASQAQRFYTRMGFVRTGQTQPYPLNPAELEWEMVKPIHVGD